jgi:UTP--glucose-1-phosphate uridylyltransferase
VRGSPGQRVIHRAVIPAVGVSTGMFPATKSQPLEMLPIVDRPAIQYVVEEATGAGITDVLFVTGSGRSSVEDHFDRSPALEQSMSDRGEHARLADLHSVRERCRLHTVRTRGRSGAGGAVLAARRHVGRDPFVVLLGDEIVRDGDRLVTRMMQVHECTGAPVIALLEAGPGEMPSHPCARTRTTDSGLVEITEILDPAEAPDEGPRFVIIGRYVLNADVVELLDDSTASDDEIRITDAIRALLPRRPVYAVPVGVPRYGMTSSIDFLRANVELALRRDDLAPGVAAMLASVSARQSPPETDVGSH